MPLSLLGRRACKRGGLAASDISLTGKRRTVSFNNRTPKMLPLSVCHLLFDEVGFHAGSLGLLKLQRECGLPVVGGALELREAVDEVVAGRGEGFQQESVDPVDGESGRDVFVHHVECLALNPKNFATVINGLPPMMFPYPNLTDRRADGAMPRAFQFQEFRPEHNQVHN